MKAYFLTRLGLALLTGLVVAPACGGDSDGDSGGDAGSNDASVPVVEAGLSDSSVPDGSEPPPFSTGLEGGAPLGGLSPDDFGRVCSELDDYYEQEFGAVALKPTLCNLTGVLAVVELADIGGENGGGGTPSTSELRTTCAAARDACLLASADATADRLGIDEFEMDCDQPDPSCDVTVSELETCANDLSELKGRLERTVPACDNLTLTALVILALGFEEPTAPESCERMNRCNSDAGAPGAGN